MTWQQLLVLITYHRERIRAWCAKSSMISCKLPSPTEETEISNFESKTTLSGHSCSPAGRLSSQSSKFLGGSGVFGLLFFCSCFSSSSYWARIACTRGSIDVVESECYLDELLWFFLIGIEAELPGLMLNKKRLLRNVLSIRSENIRSPILDA